MGAESTLPPVIFEIAQWAQIVNLLSLSFFQLGLVIILLLALIRFWQLVSRIAPKEAKPKQAVPKSARPKQAKSKKK